MSGRPFRLARRVAGRLAGGSWGRPTLAVSHAGSTMEIARALAVRGAPDGTAVLAGEQTAGRGRRGRPFVSPRGGLYLSILAPAPGDPARAPRAALLAALAAAGALERYGARARIVWPNDLYQGERKVGGVLAELLTPAGRQPRVVLGVGLNLGPDPSRFRPEAAGPAGAVRSLTAADPVADVAAELLLRIASLQPALDGSASWADALESLRSRVEPREGSPVRLILATGETVEGIARGLDGEGALLVRRPGGVVRVRSGEVVVGPASA